MYNFRTDMADERYDIFRKVNKIDNKVAGVESYESVFEEKHLKSNTVKILNEDGERALGKPIGKYITYDLKNIKIMDDKELEDASNIISGDIKNMVGEKISKQDEVLIVGLGNQFVTPDSLGPKVVSEIDITRHLINYAPEYVVEGTRAISAVAPGVLGTTGIETVEIVKGIVDNIKPKLIIVIDSLATKSIDRISSTIQISDTGIAPGSGVENKRKELSKVTLGIPVIAIGVPMVIDLATISDKYNMMVTPKEVDELIENMKEIVAKSINLAL